MNISKLLRQQKPGEIIDHYVEIAKLHVLKKRIKVMGKYFQPKPEDEKLMKKLKNFKG